MESLTALAVGLLVIVSLFAAIFTFLTYANQLLAWKYAVAPKGSAVFITGTSSGIGKAAALHFAGTGMLVFGTVRKAHDGTELKEALGHRFVPVLW